MSTAAVAEAAVAAPVEKFRADYTPFPYAIESVGLEFDVRDDETLVTSRLSLSGAAATAAGTPLELNGEGPPACGDLGSSAPVRARPPAPPDPLIATRSRR